MKSSRNNILAAISNHKPPHAPLPEMGKSIRAEGNLLEDFTRVAVSIGSKVFPVEGDGEVEEIIDREFAGAKRIISKAALAFTPEENLSQAGIAPHSYHNVDLAILQGRLGVAENGAIWVSEKEMSHRVLPFICQHLALVIRKKDLVKDMHQAYELLGDMEEGFGTFIAGPSKTADIEQSLVLGAHGPRSLSIFIIKEDS